MPTTTTLEEVLTALAKHSPLKDERDKEVIAACIAILKANLKQEPFTHEYG